MPYRYNGPSMCAYMDVLIGSVLSAEYNKKEHGDAWHIVTYVAGYETESTPPPLLCWPLFDRNHRNSIQKSRGDVLGNKRSRVCIGIGTSRGGTPRSHILPGIMSWLGVEGFTLVL